MEIALQSASPVGIPVVFIAGVASFLSPCVLPLVPGYLAFMGGTGAELMDGRRIPIRKVLPPTLSFISGFTVVFVALGMTASVLGAFLVGHQTILTRISGVVIVVMGLAFMGVIPIRWLYAERRFHAKASRTIPGAFAMGLAFGFGWTPCIGPALAATFAIAATSPSAGRGAVLLLVYSLGLGLPFAAAAVGTSRLLAAVRWLRQRQMILVRTSGALLVVVGLVFAFNKVFVISSFLQKAMERSGLDFWSRL